MFSNWKTTVAGIAAFLIGGCTAMKWISAETGATLASLVVAIIGLLSADGTTADANTKAIKGVQDVQWGINRRLNP